MSDKTQLLHEAVEQEAGPSLTVGEVLALLVLAIGAGVFGLLVALVAWLWHEHGLTWSVAAAAGFVIAGGLALLVGAARAIEGRRAWREAKSYAPGPGLPQPENKPGHPPILIRAGDRTAYLDRADEPLALPSPERQRLELTPRTVSVILREIVERHGGAWSRARIMGVRVDGQSVPRRLYEELTDALTRAGVLSPAPRGGYEFSVDVQCLEDLSPFFPGLGLAGPDGGRAGGPERGPGKDASHLGGAERARRRWLERGGQ